MKEILYTSIISLVTCLVTWFFARRKSNAESKSTEIDNEAKSAVFYQNLLDDAAKRINQCLEIIDNLNIKIAERDKIIESQDVEKRQLQNHIKELIDSNETLTTELKKFKQLNGKQQ